MTKGQLATKQWRIKNKMLNEAEGYPKFASPQMKALWKHARSKEV